MLHYLFNPLINPTKMKHLIRTTNEKLKMMWNDICDEYEKGKENAIQKLRNEGVKAAHPDDGWVDREKNYVILTYPQFNDGVDVEDVIALGWHSDGFRKVTVTKIEKSLFELTYYYFKA